jgi:hypothetical protein
VPRVCDYPRQVIELLVLVCAPSREDVTKWRWHVGTTTPRPPRLRVPYSGALQLTGEPSERLAARLRTLYYLSLQHEEAQLVAFCRFQRLPGVVALPCTLPGRLLQDCLPRLNKLGQRLRVCAEAGHHVASPVALPCCPAGTDRAAEVRTA